MGASTTADGFMIDRRSKAYFYEKIDAVYEDNRLRGKLRFTIKVKMHLRFTRNGRLRIYEDNKCHLRFTKIINRRLRFTKIPLYPPHIFILTTAMVVVSLYSLLISSLYFITTFCSLLSI